MRLTLRKITLPRSSFLRQAKIRWALIFFLAALAQPALGWYYMEGEESSLAKSVGDLDKQVKMVSELYAAVDLDDAKKKLDFVAKPLWAVTFNIPDSQREIIPKVAWGVLRDKSVDGISIESGKDIFPKDLKISHLLRSVDDKKIVLRLHSNGRSRMILWEKKGDIWETRDKFFGFDIKIIRISSGELSIMMARDGKEKVFSLEFGVKEAKTGLGDPDFRIDYINKKGASVDADNTDEPSE